MTPSPTCGPATPAAPCARHPYGSTRPVPGALLPGLTWRNARGRTRSLKYVVDGRLENSIGLQGFYRLTPESAEAPAGIVEGARRDVAPA
ncbi:hypothetical protein [Streptomyces sp. NPDC001478]